MDLLGTGIVFAIIATAIKWTILKKHEHNIGIRELIWIPQATDVLGQKELLVAFIGQVVGLFWILTWLIHNLVRTSKYTDLLSLVFFYFPFVVVICLLFLQAKSKTK